MTKQIKILTILAVSAVAGDSFYLNGKLTKIDSGVRAFSDNVAPNIKREKLTSTVILKFKDGVESSKELAGTDYTCNTFGICSVKFNTVSQAAEFSKNIFESNKVLFARPDIRVKMEAR